MTIVQKPSSINLSGNLPSFIIFSDDPFSFELKRASVSLFSGSYIPGSDRKVSIDVKDVIESVLSFQFRDILETYTQDTLIDTFNAYINDELICKFEVIKGGISNFGMTPQTFLQQHFLTWQPREKKVSYSSPEYLTYYAVTDCRVKLRAYIGDVETREIVISELQQGKIYTIPVMYAVISGKLDSYPACYDIWVESTDGSVRYSYIQRFVYEQTKSEQEDYIIFENSLGGVDCFRAYGNTVFNADNTHNIAIIDEQLNEYRIDTEYKYTKNTGYLNQYEMEWLKDFFPSTGKYIFKNNMLRKIVMIEDNVSSSEQDAVGSYEFTYRYADDNIYLNLPIHANSNTLASPMSIQSYNINNSLDLEPRMAEFPMQKLSEGTLFPVQEPFSESWHATNAGALANYIIEKINSLTDGRLLDNRFKGYYLTETSLKESYPNPLKGDSAWVGEPFPGVVYTVENGKWKTSGKAPEFGDINLEDYATKEDLAAQDEKLAELSSAKINIIRDNELDTLITPGIYQRYITEDGYYKVIYLVSKDGAGKFFQLKILITTTGSVDISSRSTENNGTSWSDWVDYQTDVKDSITSLQELKISGVSDEELNSLITPGIYQRKPFGDYNVLYFVARKNRTSLPYKISQMKLFVSNDGEITISSRSSEDGGGNWTDWSENIFYEMYTRIEKLENNTLNKENIFTYQNLYDELSSTKGKYLSQDGSEAENELYAISDFIPFTKGMGYLSSWVNGSANDNGSAYVILYDEDKLKVNSYDLNTCKGIATWEEGISFARFSIRNYQDGNVQIVIGKSKQSYRSYNKTFKTSLLGLEKSSTIEGTLTSQQTLSLPLSYIRKNNSISAEIEGNGITNFKIGYGLSGKYQGFWAEVTSTNVNICQFVSSETLKNTYQHNLTISDKVFVSIVSNYTTAKLVLAVWNRIHEVS